MRTLLSLAGLVLTASSSAAQFPEICPPHAFPGDAAAGAAVGDQDAIDIAAGGPGALVVWEDERAVLSGTIGTAFSPLTGNELDIYAARLDANGAVVDAEPIVVCNLGRNQRRPRVAWNGTSWLVVFESQRPEWFYDEDVLAVRVAADGTVLDPDPIVVRPYDDVNFQPGSYPSVGSDGENWLVAWQDFVYEGFLQYPAIAGTRIAPDGTLLDPTLPTLHQHGSPSFGPREPQVGSATGINGTFWTVAWQEAVGGSVLARAFTPALASAGPAQPVGTGTGYRMRMASSGDAHFLVSGDRGFLVNELAMTLGAGTTALPNSTQGWQPTGPSVAWTGASWAVAFSGASSPALSAPNELWTVRVAADGTLIDLAETQVPGGTKDADSPVVAGDAAGGVLIAYHTRVDTVAGAAEDVEAVHVASNGATSAREPVAVGLPRQSYVKWCRADDVHLAVFVSQTSGRSRIQMQRFDDLGTPLDLEPVTLHQGSEFHPYRPDVAWNGEVFLVAWNSPTGAVVGRRVTPELGILGFGDTQLLAPAGEPGVGALGGDFLVTGTYFFSGDQRLLHGIRVSGANLAPLDAQPFLIGGNYSFPAQVVGLGARWLVVWPRQSNHDSSFRTVRGQFVDASGALSGTSFTVNGPGQGTSPSVAVSGPRALVVYADDDIEGRLVEADGTLGASEFSIGAEIAPQGFPSVAWDDTQFVATWVDWRGLAQIEPLRGDVYLARVGATGAVLDPGGVALTSGPLPEDLPAVTGGQGRAVVAYSALGPDAEVPEVQRLVYRAVECSVCQPDLGFGGPGGVALSVCGETLATGHEATLELNGAPSNAPLLIALSSEVVPLELFGGTLAAFPTLYFLPGAADASGSLSATVKGGKGPADFVLQALVLDPTLPELIAFSNAVRLEYLP